MRPFANNDTMFGSVKQLADLMKITNSDNTARLQNNTNSSATHVNNYVTLVCNRMFVKTATMGNNVLHGNMITQQQ